MCRPRVPVSFHILLSGIFGGLTSTWQLLYAWHHKKERLPELPWGIIAPLSLDTSSKTERTHAFATIDAYCSHHSLQLVAMISIPFSGYYSARRMFPVNPGNSNSHILVDDVDERVLSLHTAQEDVLEDLIFRDILQPVLLTQHYVRMLGKASGRVIMISQDSEGSIRRCSRKCHRDT